MPIKRNYRGLGRTSSHRQALLRNLLTSLVQHESIETTWHKAKETQKLADRLITYGKKGDTPAQRSLAQSFLTIPTLLPKLFGPLAERFKERPGGYTRVLRIPDRQGDKAALAVLEFVDGPKDVRFSLTAKTIARNRVLDQPLSELTLRNLGKVTRFRKEGEAALEEAVLAESQVLSKAMNKRKTEETLLPSEETARFASPAQASARAAR
ncbi:50S ribosomal protein L17 [Protomyces lactucae-debilis]|uniref:50S ribosomal protein L17 n=1 Tax=Protomyces lactucae-debilis TaxID=2754530 RepID=A0A1Y2F144_PROLT|nr:50S ribosomal protein L17 [Protomyces lactucae-debilis]ORY76685.1 50S ribosomal protein L17 [Protomyces lactucae-debilis]